MMILNILVILIMVYCLASMRKIPAESLSVIVCLGLFLFMNTNFVTALSAAVLTLVVVKVLVFIVQKATKKSAKARA